MLDGPSISESAGRSHVHVWPTFLSALAAGLALLF